MNTDEELELGLSLPTELLEARYEVDFVGVSEDITKLIGVQITDE